MLDKKPVARPSLLDMAQDASIVWRYLAPVGTTIEMCLAPEYWAQCSRELGQTRVIGRHAWNKLEIISEDGTWEAELRVITAEPDRVFVRLLRYWQSDRVTKLPAGYDVAHVPGNGWRVMNHQGAILTEKLATEDEAVRFAHRHSSPPKRGKEDN